MPADAWAHTQVDVQTGGLRSHALDDHLQAVGQLAGRFSERFGGPWAGMAGRWHDLGKYRPGFQRYIRQDTEAHIEGRLPSGSDKTHSAAGALHALTLFRLRWGQGGEKAARALAYVIAGHHAGLANWTADDVAGGLETRLLGTGAGDAQREYNEALQAARAALPAAAQGLDLPETMDLRLALGNVPGLRSAQPLALSMWVRMLFSALVDADFLDTEAFMDSARPQVRAGQAPLSQYLSQLDAHLQAMAAEVSASGRAEDRVMQARTAVLQQCRSKAALPPGVFTLAVPTGGGKTLSSLAFALQHAVAHGQRRVIYAIPYTSIIEQTVDVFARIFGRGAVLEHHSQAEGGKADDGGSRETARSRLACENWDAPLVVTTNLQLFESLFAARTSRCRKLHRLAGSVIVLDEAQLLPPDFLQPILDALHVLVAHYGVTLLLCTATQPVLTDAPRFDPRLSLRGLPQPTPLIDDPASLYAGLRRTQVHWPADLAAEQPLETLADELCSHGCVLVVVNTRKDAAELLALLDARSDTPALHLSAAMCGQHRADSIADIRHRLAQRRSGLDMRPLRVVSTQLVEAGVDIDFPVVYRALAGLDSIAQAAGRCNREGALPDGALGQVHVFVRAIPKALTAVRNGAQATRSVLAAGQTDALLPQVYERYFPLYHGSFPSRDRHGIVDLLARDKAQFAFQFRTAAERFKLVDDSEQASVIVPYRSPGSDPGAIDAAVQALLNNQADRWRLRQLQRYTVNIRTRLLHGWQQRGDVTEVLPALYLLNDPLRYDPRLGLMPEGAPMDAASFVA
jgi:CRISPR-associated endonuclease/helicase Cas3